MKPKTRPKMNQGLMTGDVSKLLHITIWSAEKLFERGILTGYRLP